MSPSLLWVVPVFGMVALLALVLPIGASLQDRFGSRERYLLTALVMLVPVGAVVASLFAGSHGLSVAVVGVVAALLIASVETLLGAVFVARRRRALKPAAYTLLALGLIAMGTMALWDGSVREADARWDLATADVSDPSYRVVQADLMLDVIPDAEVFAGLGLALLAAGVVQLGVAAVSVGGGLAAVWEDRRRDESASDG